jgi:hypothetical protein
MHKYGAEAREGRGRGRAQGAGIKHWLDTCNQTNNATLASPFNDNFRERPRNLIHVNYREDTQISISDILSLKQSKYLSLKEPNIEVNPTRHKPSGSSFYTPEPKQYNKHARTQTLQ